MDKYGYWFDGFCIAEPVDTLEEAYAKGRQEALERNKNKFFVGQKTFWEYELFEGYCSTAEELVDQSLENFCTNVGFEDGIYESAMLHISKEDNEELTKLLQKTFIDFCKEKGISHTMEYYEVIDEVEVGGDYE